MDTKSKSWTSRHAVKSSAFSIAIICLCSFLFSLYFAVQENYKSGTSPDIILVDLNNAEGAYFLDNNIHSAYDAAATLLALRDEGYIRNADNLLWRRPWDGNDNSNRMLEFKGNIDYTGWINYWVDASQYNDPEARKNIENQLVQEVLDEFNRAKREINNTEGLVYYISDGAVTYSNTENTSEDFFLSHSAYRVANGENIQQSHDVGHWMHNEFGKDIKIYLAFDEAVINARTAVLRTSQSAYFTCFIQMGIALVLGFAAVIVLLVGAGRKWRDSENAVHYTIFDWIFLDVGVCILGPIVALGIIGSIDGGGFLLGYAISPGRVLFMAAALSIFVGVPVLMWLCSLAKRVKGGAPLKYTLIYWVLSRLAAFVSSLWAGVPLTAKAVGISLAFFIASTLFAFTYEEEIIVLAFILSLGVAVLLLRYAKKLHLLEIGARLARDGIYDPPIPVSGGELGKIADSINHVSAGINAAVTERMKSERLKTELITNVSHDIRTPLTSLITYTDLLKNEGLECERAPEYLEVLIQKSQRLKTLTDELFEASKAASGNIDVKLESLNLSDFIKQVLGELDERVQSSGLDFRLNIPENAMVHADGKLLWRVMENLLSNVFKYAQAASRVYIDITDEGKLCRLDIKNISEYPLNIDPAELTERFKRGDEARSGDGSGLGLSIVQSFVEAQGGRLALTVDGDLFKATIYLNS